MSTILFCILLEQLGKMTYKLNMDDDKNTTTYKCLKNKEDDRKPSLSKYSVFHHGQEILIHTAIMR